MAEVTKTAAPKEGDNPKVAAPAGTVPSSMQGATIPHPSTDTPDTSNDSKEEAEARIRALELDDEDEDLPAGSTLGEPVGDPVQCIVKQKFFDERGALVKAGATYFYQERRGKRFPAKVLEPVSKAKAAAVRKEQRAYEEDKEEERRAQVARRAEFSRLMG